VGLDFITTCTPTFQRSWDRNRVELTEPDLFRRHPELAGRTFRLAPSEGGGVGEGEAIILRWCATDLMAYRERSLVGVVANPPRALLDAIDQAGGALCARVERVHRRSGAADISIVP
jgi:hypothetical protein